MNGNSLVFADYAIDPTGVSDMHTKLDNAITDSITLKKALMIPGGQYRVSSDLVTNLTSVPSQGVNIYGEGRGSTYLAFDPGKGWNVTANSGADTVFGRIAHMHIGGTHTGAFFMFGRSDLTANINEFLLDDLYISNGSPSGAASALQLNGFYNGYVNAVINGGGYTIGTKTGIGFAALDLQQCAFTTFLGSYGLSGAGGILRTGSVYGNTFVNVDTEACTNCWVMSHSAVKNNTWIGGQISLATTGVAASAGTGHLFINTNFEPTSMTNNVSGTTGLWLRTPGLNNITSTPSFPTTGGTATNTTGHTVRVIINGSGTMAGVFINGTQVISTTSTSYTFTLEPGDTIAFTYSGSYGWAWLPLR